MKRFLSVLLCAAMMLTLASAAFAAGLGLSVAPKATPTSATLWFDNAEKRTIVEENVHHIWADNGITFDTKLTNPANASTKIPTSVWPAQLTKGSTMTLKYPSMTAFEIICNSATFANNYQKSITDSNVTVTVTGNTILVVLPEAVDSYAFDLSAGNGYAFGVTVYTGTEAPVRTADQDAAEFAIYAISAIGTVTLESQNAIDAARAFYSTLTDAQKAMVTNYEVLTAAEAEWKALGGQPAETAVVENAVARTQFDPRTYTAVFTQNGVTVLVKLPNTSTSQPNYATIAANADVTIIYPGMTKLVIESAVNKRGGDYVDKIVALFETVEGATVTTDGLIITVAFNAPRDSVHVVAASSLSMATMTVSTDPIEPSADEKAAAAVEAQIEAIGTVTLASETAIKSARGAYDALTDAQKALVANYEVLTAAEGTLQELKKEAETPVVPAGDNAIVYFAMLALSATAGVVVVSKKKEF